MANTNFTLKHLLQYSFIGDCFALKEDGLYCNEHHKVCDKLDSSDPGGENNNNKHIQNHNRDLSEDGDDKSEEGRNDKINHIQ